MKPTNVGTVDLFTSFLDYFDDSMVFITPHGTYPRAIRSRVAFAPRVVALSIQEPGASSSFTSKLVIEGKTSFSLASQNHVCMFSSSIFPRSKGLKTFSCTRIQEEVIRPSRTEHVYL